MFEKIKSWLNQQGIEFKEVSHEPTLTSEQSAMARGEDLSIGGKAILMKLGDQYKLFVISAAKKIDSKAIKNYFGVKKLRFADKDELMRLTSLVPGSVPPFGKPFFDLELYIDESLTKNEKIAFNAASLTNSIIMRMEDYLKIVQAVFFNFSVE